MYNVICDNVSQEFVTLENAIKHATDLGKHVMIKGGDVGSEIEIVGVFGSRILKPEEYTWKMRRI